MNAVAVFPGQRRISLVDHPEPKLAAPTHVKLRMLEIGICGTDKEIAEFKYGTPPQGSDYLVLGHESLGQVVEAGAGVSRLKVGDLVVPMVRRPCPFPNCQGCQSGRQDFCYTGAFTERGIKMAHGFMTELVVDDQRYMNVVPPTLRETAILVEPLTIAEKAIAQMWQVQQRLPWSCPIVPGKKEQGYCHNAVVLGAGPVGLLGAMALIVNGFKTYVYSLEEPPHPKVDFVNAIKATYVSSKTHSVEQLAEQVGNIDMVYEATGASKIAFDLMRVLGTNGVFVFTGVPGRKAPVEVDTDLIMRNLVLKNQVIYGTVNAGQGDFESAVRDLEAFMQRWPQQTRSLITGRYAIGRYDDLLLGRVGGTKNVVTLNGAR